MQTKKEEEETDDAEFSSLKVLMDHEDKDSKSYIVKVKQYDSGTPEEFFIVALYFEWADENKWIRRKV
jgi:hypothetical protein